MIRRSSLLAGLVALLPSVSPGRAEARFVKSELALPGSILWMATGDLDGDGRTDLVFSYRRGAGPKAAKFLAVFLRGPNGYSTAPDLAIPAPRSAGVFDVGDAIGDGKDELVYIAPDGVYAQEIVNKKASAPTRIVTVPSLVAQPEEDDLVTWDFLRAAGGQPLMLIPTRGPLRMFKREGEAWKPWSRADIDEHSTYDAEVPTFRRDRRGGSTGRPYAFRATTVVPNLDLVDQTGDGKADLVASYEDRVQVFPQLDDGTISLEPKTTVWFSVRTPEEMETRDSGVSTQILDLDGDGIADACVSKIAGGVTTLATETRLYRGKKGGGFDMTPAQVFKDDGFAALATFLDVDGDGKLEMVHPHSEVSIMGVSQMMLKKELSLDVRIRRSAEKPLFFEPSPAQTIETVYGLDLSVGATLRGTFPVFGYDFDGDGVKDVIMSAGGSKMVLHRGQKGREPFEGEGHVTLSAPGTNMTRVVFPDVKHAERPDLVLYYLDRADLAGKIVVFSSQP